MNLALFDHEDSLKMWVFMMLDEGKMQKKNDGCTFELEKENLLKVYIFVELLADFLI
jgi:hypothetical protein